MKMKIVLSSILLSLVAAASEKSPMQCKVGFKEIARCSGVKLLSVPQDADELTREIAQWGLALFQDVMVCKNADSTYVQMNTTEDGESNISPEMPASYSSSNATHLVHFRLRPTTSCNISYGDVAGAPGEGNGQLIMTVEKRSSAGDNYLYAVQCNSEKKD